MVSDVPKPKPAAKMVSSSNLTESTLLKPTIEDIHDRSENAENAENKLSMKNVLYEPGKYAAIAMCLASSQAHS